MTENWEITYLLNYTEPEEGQFKMFHRGTPSIKRIKTELLTQRPHLVGQEHLIQVQRTIGIEVKKEINEYVDYGTDL